MNDFPIPSQTSDLDKRAILMVRSLMPQDYKYLEIGSFRGGSLVPFLRDPRCARVLSVDPRPRQPIADERPGVFNYDYTLESMLAELGQHEVPVDKLHNFVGEMQGVITPHRFDLLFIDGEHTDVACFRDFAFASKFLKPDSVIMFHDATLVTKALRNVVAILEVRNSPFRFVKVKDCEVALAFLGSYSRLPLENQFEFEPDLAGWYRGAEQLLLNLRLQEMTK